jgi:H+-translocating NAD(P) transhydrogenase subunit alpha
VPTDTFTGNGVILMIRLSLPKEIAPGETRVALIPETVGKLVKAGLEVFVEAGAGTTSGHEDAAYTAAGATVTADIRDLYARGDVVPKVRGPMMTASGAHEVDWMKPGAVLVGFLDPTRNADLLARLAARNVTALSMELVPRITRAQKMDALSSMSTVAGYKAALLAANSIGKFFPLFMTAAGTIAPARVFILGAGVAGLQAIATARRLGAVVEAFDIRPAVKDEVKSLGATFVGGELVSAESVDKGGYAKEVAADQQTRIRELTAKHVKAADVVITTANVPGRRAPLLVTAAMVADMKPGSIIVDMAAETGGNCELTQPGKNVVVNGVTIFGPLDLVTGLPVHASQMYSRNVHALLGQILTKEGTLKIDLQDEITGEVCVTHEGRVLKGTAPAGPPATPSPPQPEKAAAATS